MKRPPRKPFAGLALCAAAGILCADRWPVNPYPLAAGLLACAVLLVWKPFLPGCYLFTAGAFFLFHTIDAHPGRVHIVAPGVVRLSGAVADEPEQTRGFHDSPGAKFLLRLDDGTQSLVRWTGPAPAYGDRVECVGTLSGIPGPRNWAQFDYAAYMRRLNTHSELEMRFPSDGRIVGRGEGNPVLALAFKARHWMERRLGLDLEDEPECAGLIESLVLGVKRETPDDKELFRRTGTLHLFTVNGLHVAMLASIAWFLLRFTGIGRSRAVLLILPLLAFYAAVTGLSSGSVRATIMASVWLFGELLDRRPLALNSLAAACFFIFLWDTNQLFLPGFQFSFGVVLAIILLAGRFRERFVDWVRPDPFLPRPLWGRWRRWNFAACCFVANLAAVSLAAWIGSLPFTANYLHLCSPAAVLVNVAVVPIAYGILSEGILSLLSSWWNWLSITFNNANLFLAKGLLVVVHLFARIPGGHFYFELPRWRPPLCELTVFDLGSGGSIHLRAEGRDWLVDSGNTRPYGEIVLSYLRSRGVNRLDDFVLTHGGAKNAGAAAELLGDLAPSRIFQSPLGDRWRGRRAFQAAAGAVETVKRGDVLRVARDVELRVVYPPPDLVARAADDKALALQVSAGGCKALLMSDGGFVTEHWLLDHERDLKSDILIKGQHAADVSGSLDFIDAVHPAAIICASFKYPAGAHIADSWAASVAARGIRLFRQDECGAVRVDLRREGWEINSFLDGACKSGARQPGSVPRTPSAEGPGVPTPPP